MKNFTRNMIYERNYQMQILEVKYKTTELINSTEVFDRLDRAEELISKPENRSVENTQSESTEENIKENAGKSAKVMQYSESSNTHN